MGMTLLGRDAETDALLDDVSAQLSDESTGTARSRVAFALVAVAQNTGAKPFKGFSFDYSAGKAHGTTVKGETPLATLTLPAPPAAGIAAHAEEHLGPQALRDGQRARGAARAARKTRRRMACRSRSTYSDADGKPVDVAQAAAGQRPHRADRR